MMSIPMVGTVLVSIVSAMARASSSAWDIEYEVRNEGQALIWLVVDESVVFRLDNGRIELSYARGQMQSGAHVFGYFDPKVVEIPPGGSLRRSVEITWPYRLSDLWNSEREAAPAPGEYEISIRVGYAATAAPESPKVGESVEATVMRWQRTTVSPPAQIAIPPYTRSYHGGE
jgi:hypothetical protein